MLIYVFFCRSFVEQLLVICDFPFGVYFELLDLLHQRFVVVGDVLFDTVGTF